LATGRLLLEAKRLLPSKPQYGRWFEAQRFGFSTEWGRRFRLAAEREAEVRAAIATAVANETDPAGVNAMLEYLRDPGVETEAHVSHNSGESEWFTPQEIIDAARRVMGGIDLDPASTEVANTVVGASTFYTAEDDGLAQPWFGRVWLNPPYSQPLVDWFSTRVVREYGAGAIEQACILVNNATETAWLQRIARVASALCFPAGRVRFWYPDRESVAPLQGQVVLYFGDRVGEFREEFGRLGFTVVP
jgi:ParB family chromosome partitioning protein